MCVFSLLLFSINVTVAQTAIFNSSMSVTPYGNVSSPGSESFVHIIDSNVGTKFLDFDSGDGMGFTVDLGGDSKIASSIDITTANDVDGRDPRNYEISGSNDGYNFTSITTGTINCISDRFFTRNYSFANSTAYKYYRINFTNTCGDSMFQLAEVQLYTCAQAIGGAISSNQTICGNISSTPNAEANLNSGGSSLVSPDIYDYQCQEGTQEYCYWDGEQEVCESYYDPCMYQNFNYTQGHTAAQSFMTSNNIILNAIKIDVANVINNGSYILSIFQGEGESGPQLSNQGVYISNSGTNTFTLNNTLELIAGQSYTFKLQSNDGYAQFNWTNSNDNDYIKGSGYVDGNNNYSDFNFQLVYQNNINWQSITLNGHQGGVQKWQKDTDVNFSNPTDIASTSATLDSSIVGDIFQTTYFRAVVVGCSTVFSDYATITVSTPTVNTTTISACENYTWNGTTYTESGIYTGGTTNCITEKIDLTINIPSVAGSISGSTTVSSGSNSPTLTLIGSTGNIQWQSATTQGGTYSDISGANSETYTATNLTTTTYFRVIVTNGACLSATSLPVVVNVSGTHINNSQCGTTLSALNSTITCYPVTAATAYKFKIITQSTGIIRYVTSATNSFNLSQVTGTLYNTNYSISVAATIGGLLKAYGSACTITTPYPLTKVKDNQCGATLATINSTIYTAATFSGAKGYRFEVSNGANIYTFDSSTYAFNLSQLNVPILFGETYSIRVSVKLYNVWQPYGSSCFVYTPVSPVQVLSRQCGATLTAINSIIYSTVITAATGYRFEVTNNNNVYTYDSLTGSFNLSQLNIPVLYDNTYSIRVSAKLYNVWQPYGSSCSIYTPASPTKVLPTQCGATLTSINSNIYSTGVTAATSYRFEVTNGNNVYTYDSLTKYFNLSQLNAPVLYGGTYSIRVSAKLYNVWQPYGATCTVYTPSAPLTKLQTTQCGITLAAKNETILYANAISVAQMYRFEISLGDTIYTYDTTSSSVRSFKLTDVSGLTLANGTTYTIRVAIKANNVWQPYGPSCNVTTFGTPPTVVKAMVLDTLPEDIFNVVASPNPFTENFNLSLTTSSEEKITVSIYEMTGKLVFEDTVNSTDVSGIRLGINYPSGVYNIVLNQGANSKTLRVIKR